MSIIEIIHEMEALGAVVIIDSDEHLAEALDEIGIEESE